MNGVDLQFRKITECPNGHLLDAGSGMGDLARKLVLLCISGRLLARI
jgi:hypothetical protein